MNLALTVLQITAPVFLLGAIGFGWVKLGFEYPLRFVSRLAMTLAVPCLIFTALMQTEIDPAALTELSLATIVAYGIVIAVAWILVIVAKLDRRTFLAPISFGNTGNLGLPLAYFAFQDQGLGFAIVIFAIMAVMAFSFGLWLVSGGGGGLKILTEPMLIGTLLGALFLWQGWQTPDWLTNALELVGQMAIPLMLITLGVAVGRLRPGRLGQALWISLAKAALCAAVGIGIGQVFDLGPVALAVLILQLITPVAVTSYLLAEKFNADAEAVAGLVVVSTVLSILTLPIALAFLL